jgi:hypothetical protein
VYDVFAGGLQAILAVLGDEMQRDKDSERRQIAGMSPPVFFFCSQIRMCVPPSSHSAACVSRRTYADTLITWNRWWRKRGSSQTLAETRVRMCDSRATTLMLF